MKLSLRLSPAGVLSSLLVVAALGWSAPAFAQDLSSTGSPIPRAEGGKPVDLARLTASSNLIVRGRVLKGEPRWAGRVIYTFYDVAVHETLKGVSSTTVSVAVAGGALGNVQLIVPQTPAFTTGDELVFFGQPFAGEKSTFRPTGTAAGLIPILSSDKKQASVAPRGKLEDLADFLTEVRKLNDRL